MFVRSHGFPPINVNELLNAVIDKKKIKFTFTALSARKAWEFEDEKAAAEALRELYDNIVALKSKGADTFAIKDDEGIVNLSRVCYMDIKESRVDFFMTQMEARTFWDYSSPEEAKEALDKLFDFATNNM